MNEAIQVPPGYSSKKKKMSDLLDAYTSRLKDVGTGRDVFAERLDNEFRAALSTLLYGQSPVQLVLAYIDWLSHLALAPGKQLELHKSLWQKIARLGFFNILTALDFRTKATIADTDHRFASKNWHKWPFCVMSHSFALTKAWWDEATEGVAGASDEHQALVRFIADQMLEAVSPANFMVTNADVLQTTLEEKGRNLLRGARNLSVDAANFVLRKKTPPSHHYRVGETVAISVGKVIFRNDLMELIQYQPLTEVVGAEPVVFCPAWIMKYYIQDLSPKNSMVKYLLEQGKTVFMISWKNPDKHDRQWGFNDYLDQGLKQAIDVVSVICPERKVHAVGYCIGGTLLTIGAAAMARDGDNRLKSITLFAAQVDFAEAGELRLFTSSSQLEFVDKYMLKRGVLGSENMGSTFRALHAGDLVYAPRVNRYLLGQEKELSDLMAWNADGTNMPHKMHSEYLQCLYLHNELAANKFRVGDAPVSLTDIRIPMFVVGTENDHVAPWKSVYKVQALTRTDVTFLLASGGHNAGIICGPQNPRHHYRIHVHHNNDRYLSPDAWLSGNTPVQGSWWPVWNEWLDAAMSGQSKPPAMGANAHGYRVLGDAPGQYVYG